jgi:hypothetical protein
VSNRYDLEVRKGVQAEYEPKHSISFLPPDFGGEVTIMCEDDPYDESRTEIVVVANLLTKEEIERIVVLDGAGNIWHLKNPYAE